MSFNKDTYLIFEKYTLMHEKVGVENVLNLLQNKNEKIASKLLEMDKTPSKGHALKLAKFFNEIQNLDILDEYYKKFLVLKKKNKIEDITRFEKFSDFEHKIDELQQSVKLTMPDEVADAEKAIYEDSNVKIFLGDNQSKCIRLGSNYSFCISRPSSGNLYTSYRLRDQSSFYFIRFKKRTDEKQNGKYVDPSHLIVLDVLPGNEYKWTWADNGSQGHGTNDTTQEEILKGFPELKPAFDKKIFVAKPLSQEEKSKIEKFNDLANDFNLETFNSLKYNEKEEFIQRGTSLPFEAWKTFDKNLRNEYIKTVDDFDENIFKDLKENEKAVYIKRMKQNPESVFKLFLFTAGLKEK